MTAASFHYHAPATLDEAVALLAEYGPEARILAGGQSLMPALSARLARPTHVIDINMMAEARRPTVTAERLTIPPLMRHADFTDLPVTDPLATLFATLAMSVAPLPVRLRGTFCGAIANAHPASEWCLAAAALKADIVLCSRGRGARTIPAEAFFATVESTAAEDNELVAEVRIPLLAPTMRAGFAKIARRAEGFGMALALAVYGREGGGMADVRVAVGGVSEVPRRLPAAEAVLTGRRPDARVFDRAAQAAADTVEPITSGTGDTAYQRDLAFTAVRRALERTL